MYRETLNDLILKDTVDRSSKRSLRGLSDLDFELLNSGFFMEKREGNIAEMIISKLKVYGEMNIGIFRSE